ncbi:MAG: hypothetical protein ACFFD1_05145 [Candidatus Thorarchaeota archaeon]
MKCPHCSSFIDDKNYIGLARCDNCSRAFSINHAEGRMLLTEGKLSDAIEKLELASQFMRNTALVFLDLARAYALNNQIQEMKIALERAFEIDPEFVLQNWLRDFQQPEINSKETVNGDLEELISIVENYINSDANSY